MVPIVMRGKILAADGDSGLECAAEKELSMQNHFSGMRPQILSEKTGLNIMFRPVFVCK